MQNETVSRAQSRRESQNTAETRDRKGETIHQTLDSKQRTDRQTADRQTADSRHLIAEGDWRQTLGLANKSVRLHLNLDRRRLFHGTRRGPLTAAQTLGDVVKTKLL